MPNKRVYKKKYVKKPYREYMDTAHKALKIALATKRLLNVEYKIKDTRFTGVAFGTTPSLLELTNLLQGTTISTREGNQVKFVSIFMNLVVQKVNAAIPSNTFRCMLIQDKQTNNAIFSAADVLQEVAANLNVISPLNVDNTRRFRILYDKRFVLSENGTQARYISVFKKMETKVRYSTNTGGIGDLESNSLAFMIMNDDLTTTALYSVYIRMRYVDN